MKFYSQNIKKTTTHQETKMFSHSTCLPPSWRTHTSTPNGQVPSSLAPSHSKETTSWATWPSWTSATDRKPKSQGRFLRNLLLEELCLHSKRHTRQPLPLGYICFKCLGTAVQGHLVWPGEAGCTWLPRIGLQSFLLLEGHSAEHHGRWLGSYGLCVLQQRRVVELAIWGRKEEISTLQIHLCCV